MKTDKAKENVKQLNNSKKLYIATGMSRHDKKWKNTEITYDSLVERLEATTRTQETFQEYKRSSKTKRDEIKDVGGFVGGSLKSGRRKAENVANRSLLTLDMDFVDRQPV